MVHEKTAAPSPEAGPSRIIDPDVENLAAGYLAGESAAGREVERWIQAELRRRFRGLREEHADLVQAVHEKLLSNLRAGRFRGGSLRNYVVGIAQYTAIDRMRERYRDRELQEAVRGPGAESEDPYKTLEQSDERVRLRRLLFDLPQRCRELWRLVFVERLNYTAMAERLSVPPGTVKSRMWHCRRQARDLWKRGSDLRAS